MNRLAKISLISVLLVSTLGMVGIQSAGAVTNVNDPNGIKGQYIWNLTGNVYPATPQFWCGNGQVGMYPIWLKAPSSFGTVAALITFKSWRYTGPGNLWEPELSHSPNPHLGNPGPPVMSPGGWASTSGGVWSVPQHGWYYMQVEVQWWYYSNGDISRDFAKVDVLPTTPTDYAASYHTQIYGYQVCYA